MSDQAAPPNHEVSPLNRRRLLQLAGFGLGGLWLGAGSRADAASMPWSGEDRSSIIRPNGWSGEIPEEWLEREGSALRGYAVYLSGLRLRSMNVAQIISAHAKKHGMIWNSLPPRAAWPFIVPTLRVVDAVAVQLRMPVSEVVSVYRAPAYNARCEGARSGSWHTRNVAIDFKMGASPSVVAATARALRARGLFHGGVGRYGSFVHIDTRGVDFDW